MIRAILAHDAYWGIGKNGNLPWPKNAEDLAWFKECTENSMVVMGRRTWESLPRRPLPNRRNVVVSRNSEDSNTAQVVDPNDLAQFLVLQSAPIWIIGGAQLLESCLPIVEELWLNDVGGDYDCDVFLPKQAITARFEPDTVEIKPYGVITKWKRRNNAAIS